MFCILITNFLFLLFWRSQTRSDEIFRETFILYNSVPFYIDGCEWKLEIKKRWDRYCYYVCLYLHALGTDLPRQASVTLTICGSKRNVSKAVKKYYFRSGSWSRRSCYWEDFIATDEVSGTNAGFLVNDTLTIEAMIEVHDDDDSD